jgi:WS/DGAT/MGAT family acyltransferase
MHHSTIDGVSGAELLGVLFDLEPDPPETPKLTPRHLDSRIPSGVELVAQSLMADVRMPFDLGRTALRTTRNFLGLLRLRRGESAKGALPLTAPRTSINVAVHARRRVAFAAASLTDVKALKDAMGTTVNDVVLAVCAGALRAYLLAGDELPEIPLVSVVPVSVRPDVAELKGSNKVSAMFVPLPCQLDDPLERLRVIHEGTKGAKEEHKALGATTLQNWVEHASPHVFAAAARLYTDMRLADRHRPVANLVISNVPGPDFPLYLGGSRLLGMFPLGPVMDGMGLNITIMSYRGVLYWGLASDARTVPRLWDIAAAIPEALAELMEASGLDSEPFDVPIHLGPGMPPTANWFDADSAMQSEQSERSERSEEAHADVAHVNSRRTGQETEAAG